MSSQYVLAFLLALAISLVVTPLIRAMALRVNKLDVPNWRKVHTRPIPRLGGIAITLAFLIPAMLNVPLSRPFWGLLAGVAILFTVGLVDDLKGLSARYKLLGQIIAAIVVLAGGIGIVDITNPFGGQINLDNWRIPVEFFGQSFNILPLANLISILWIVGMINTINFLDGLDGLAGGVVSIAGAVIFILALGPVGGSVTVALLAIILVGACLGFLPYNFYPSRIFMGDSGAYVIGMLLALLSIYADSKIAVGSLVLGFAIIDAIVVALRRLALGRSPFSPDRNHLHHQLLDSGLFSHRQVVVIIYAATLLVAVVLLLAGGVAASAALLLTLALIISVIRIMGPERGFKDIETSIKPTKDDSKI